MVAKPTVCITRHIPFDTLKKVFDQCIVIGDNAEPPSRETLLDQVSDAQGILSLLTERIDGEVMDAAPNLRVISNMAVGYDNIDVAAATERGIAVGNTPGVLTETTAEMAWALMMAVARRMPEGQQYVKSGQWGTWQPDLLLGKDLYGATLGIVGFGLIGAAVARRAAGFNMRVLYHRGDDTAAQTVGAQKVDFDTLIGESDFLSVHTPLNDKTYHLIGERELSLMKSSAILINTARGGVVDPAALYDALTSGEIWAAGLDVTEPEPMNADDPLLTLDNCIVVPHLGSSTERTRERMASLAVDNLLAGLRGEHLPHPVNP